jgi:hypothetical protein
MGPTADVQRSELCLHIGLSPYTPLIITATIIQFPVFLREIICHYSSSLLGLHDLAPSGRSPDVHLEFGLHTSEQRNGWVRVFLITYAKLCNL